MTAVAAHDPRQSTTVIPESSRRGAAAGQCRLAGEIERDWEREREGDCERGIEEIERNWDRDRGEDGDFERERIGSGCLCGLSSGQDRQDKLRLPACRPLLCPYPVCEKAFSSKYKLLRHMATHSLQKTHQCSVCAKMFHRKDHLKNHLQTHDPNKEAFGCAECGKSYSTKLGYKRHAAMHAAASGDLTCKVCLLRLETTPALLEHLRGHSGGAAAGGGGGAAAGGGAKEKKHPCGHCERRFYTRKDVRRHMVVHTGRKDFLCQFCAQRFGRKDHLTRHAKKSHSQELLKRGAEPRAAEPAAPPGVAVKEELSPVVCGYGHMGLYGPHLQATPAPGGAFHPLMAGSLGMGCHMEPSNPLHHPHPHPHLHPRHPHHLHPGHSPPAHPPPQGLPGSTSYLKLEVESFLMDLQSGLPASPLAEPLGSAHASDLPHGLQAESPAPTAESLCMANMDVSHLLSFLPLGLPPYSAPLSTGGHTAGYSTSSNSSSASSSSSSASHGAEPLPLTSLRSRPQEPSGHAFSSHTLPRFHQAFQ